MFEDVSVAGRLATVGLVVLAFAMLSLPHPALRRCVPSHQAPIQHLLSIFSFLRAQPIAWLSTSIFSLARSLRHPFWRALQPRTLLSPSPNISLLEKGLEGNPHQQPSLIHV